MSFHEKLDNLMILTDMTNSKLAKESVLDPSLISRWRRGLKTPLHHSDTVYAIAQVLAKRINTNLRKEKFSKMTNIDLENLSNTENFTSLIVEWLVDGQSFEDSLDRKLLRDKRYPNYKDRKASRLDPLSTAEAYCTGKDGRIAAFQWVISFVKHWPSGGTLRFYTDQPISWLNLDYIFYQDLIKQDSEVVNKFNILKILQPVNASPEEQLKVLEFAKLFMGYATINIAFIRQSDDSTFQHSMGIYDNDIAIACYGFRASTYNITLLHSDERFIHNLTIDFDTYFESAETALRFLPHFSIRDIYRKLCNIFMQTEDVCYYSTQMFLPLIPPELMNQVPGSNIEISSSEMETVFNRLEEQLTIFLQSNKLFVSLFVNVFHEDNTDKHSCVYVKENQTVAFTANQYQAMLKKALYLYENYDNFELWLLEEPIEDLILTQERQSTLYARITDKFIPYQSHHPNFVRILYKQTADNFSQALHKCNRAEVAEKLKEKILMLENT